MSRIVDVLVPVALDQTYSYRVPAGIELAPGDVVAVPLGTRESMGVVWADNPNPNPRLHNRLKDIDEKLDVPPLKPELRQFVDWVSNYTSPHAALCSHGATHGRTSRPWPGASVCAARGPPPERMTAARMRVLQLLADGLVRSKAKLRRERRCRGGE
jgi:primosomal protein N' (replication factor Y)